jgi:U4/U6.U5 tri-snRNP-associated protein 2
VVGLNNIKANDYCNVILQALSHVTPIRNYFLEEKNYSKIKHSSGDSPFALVQRFGELIRKLWNPRNFKAHVSPHEMLQSIVLWSKKRFQIIEQSDPIDFLTWFLHELHKQLRGNKKPDSSIINKTFLGEMKIFSRKIPPAEITDEAQKEALLASEEYQVNFYNFFFKKKFFCDKN